MPHVTATHIAIHNEQFRAFYVVIKNKNQVFHCTENENGLLPFSDQHNYHFKPVDQDYFRNLINKDVAAERRRIFANMADIKECLSIKRFYTERKTHHALYGGLD
jgi:hypothetical protein